MEKETQAEMMVLVKRTIAAPPDRVFEAWTSPELIMQWFCPDETFTVPIAEVDLKVGGKFRMGMKDPADKMHIATGVYQEIKKPEKLVFSWSWEHEPHDTRITITLKDTGNATEIVLKHEFLADKKIRDDHEKGWNGCMDHLKQVLERD